MKSKTSTMTQQMRDIKAEMTRVGVKNVDVAREAEVVPNYVYFVISGKRKGYRVRRAIAEMVGKPVEVLFPDTPPEHRSAA